MDAEFIADLAPRAAGYASKPLLTTLEKTRMRTKGEEGRPMSKMVAVNQPRQEATVARHLLNHSIAKLLQPSNFLETAQTYHTVEAGVQHSSSRRLCHRDDSERHHA
jgi:hypothetical protein